jgi:hypothetical protein
LYCFFCMAGLNLAAGDVNKPRIRRNLFADLSAVLPEQNNPASEQKAPKEETIEEGACGETSEQQDLDCYKKRVFQSADKDNEEPQTKYKCLSDSREQSIIFSLPMPEFSSTPVLCRSKKSGQRFFCPATPLKQDNIDISEFRRLLPEFEGIEKIGAGDQATVYKAHLVQENKPIALKVFKYGRAKEEQLTRENQYVQELGNNEHILSYLSFFKRGKFLVISMDFFPKDLSVYIKEICKTNLSVAEEVIWEFIADIALGLREFEAKGFVHRDIKPDNLFLTKENRVVIGDLGLVISLNHNDTGDYSIQTGDSRYLAIESIKEEAPTHKWDIASFGFSLLEMAALIDLSAGGDTWEALRKLGGVDSYLEPLPYSVELKDLIKAMVHPEPEMRPSATQILDHVRVKSILATRK